MFLKNQLGEILIEHFKMKLGFPFSALIISSLLYGAVTGLIFNVEKDYFKKKYNFKVKAGRKFTISFAETSHQGKKEFNQKVYLQANNYVGDRVICMNPNLVLNSDSINNSYTFSSLTDSDSYELTATGRASIYMSHTAPEKAVGFSIDASTDKRYCDFSFISTEDSTLKCTVRLENIE